MIAAAVIVVASMLNPAVTQATVHRTICVSGWTKTVRHVSLSTRHAAFASASIPWDQRGRYELDHVVPLELGGSNDRSNLSPQLWALARRKDVAENRLHDLVCAGRLDLASARSMVVKA